MDIPLAYLLILFFIFHFLYLIDKCPFGISIVIRISFKIDDYLFYTHEFYTDLLDYGV